MLHGYPLSELDSKVLNEILYRDRATGRRGAPATIARDLAVFKQFFGWLLKHKAIENDPTILLYAPKVLNKNPRPIPDEHWELLWDSADPGYEEMMLGLGFFLGLRRQEIVSIESEHLHLGTQTVRGLTRKGGGDDVLPYGELCAIFEKAPEYPGVRSFHRSLTFFDEDRLVPWSLQYVNERMQRLCEVAGIPRYTPHNLRHSFVTNLLRRGVPLHLVQNLANHASPITTARYTKAGASELKEWRESHE